MVTRLLAVLWGAAGAAVGVAWRGEAAAAVPGGPVRDVHKEPVRAAVARHVEADRDAAVAQGVCADHVGVEVACDAADEHRSDRRAAARLVSNYHPSEGRAENE